MEKPSTKKPMNVLKTMVFLKNFMNNDIYNKYNLKSDYLNIHEIKKLQTIGYCLRDFDYEHNSKYDCNEYLIYIIHELIKIQEKLEK